MKKCSKFLIRLSSGFLVILMIMGLFISSLIITSADTSESITTKAEKSYDIALAFDNSGSMYETKGWCRAKYAMEIFASMLNYDNGDRLRIYPMWEITTDGKKKSGGSYKPIEITSKEDINKISNIYTTNPNETPLTPVYDAYNDLKDSDATDKWIIVLTDGTFNQIKRGEMVGKISADDLKKKLEDVAKNDVKVQYLGFDKASKLKSNESKGFFAKKSSDTSLKDDLIDICNSIFQRSVLPTNYLKGKKLELDLSMNNLIVFAQGSNAKIASLKDSSGNEIEITLDSGQRKYSTIKATGYDNAPVDKTLAGQVVTFAACPEGSYTLEYSGVDEDKIQIFYEPNVGISVAMENEDGQEVDYSSGEIPAGDYKILSKLVDNITGEDVTNSLLLGDVNLNTCVKNGEEDYIEYKNGDKVELVPDSNTDIFVQGTYLKDYTISTLDNPDIFPYNWNITALDVEFDINATVLQSQSWYTIKDYEEWKPIKVAITVDGQELTSEQLDRTELTPKFSKKGLIYWCEPLPDESAYYIHIGTDENGNFTEPQTDNYSLDIEATYTDEYDNSVSDTDKVIFDIQNYSKFWLWLFWVLLVVGLIILITIIRNIPALPNTMYMEIPKAKACPLIKRSGNMVSLSTDTYPGELRCEAVSYTPLKNRNKKTAKFRVRRVIPLGSIQWYEINGSKYTKGASGKYYDANGKTIEDCKPLKIIGNGTEIKWKTTIGVRVGNVCINHKK